MYGSARHRRQARVDQVPPEAAGQLLSRFHPLNPESPEGPGATQRTAYSATTVLFGRFGPAGNVATLEGQLERFIPYAPPQPLIPSST